MYKLGTHFQFFRILIVGLSLFILHCSTVSPNGSIHSSESSIFNSNIPTTQDSTNQLKINTDLSYKISLPQIDSLARDSSYGLVVYFHGDGANDYDSLFETLSQISAQNGFAFLSILSPDSTTKWDEQNQNSAPEFVRSWTINGDVNEEKVWSLIQELYAQIPNIDSTRNILIGVSGGSYFLTRYFIPIYSQTFKAHSFLFCGGDVAKAQPQNSNLSDPTTIDLWYYTQLGDYTLHDAELSAENFKNLGYSVQTNFTDQGTQHCDFAVDSIINTQLENR